MWLQKYIHGTIRCKAGQAQGMERGKNPALSTLLAASPSLVLQYTITQVPVFIRSPHVQVVIQKALSINFLFLKNVLNFFYYFVVVVVVAT